MKVTGNGRSRHWIWTYNNYTPDILQKHKDIDAAYLIIGMETAPTTGTPHLQCYGYFKTLKSKSQMIKLTGGGQHMQVPDGKPEAQKAYCSKEEYYEKGELPSPGKRTDIDKMKELVKSKASVKEIYEQATSYQALRFAMAGIPLFQEKRTTKPEILWRWGVSGVGKTRWVYDTYKIDDVYVKDTSKWWDGYEQQQVILLDDYEPNPNNFRNLLRLMDRYPYQGEIKGGYVQINSPVMVFTSEYAPHHYWSGTELKQVERRIDSILEITDHDQRSG